MNEDLLIDTYQMPLMFQLTIGNYYDAIVDYISTFAVGGGNWTKVCNASSFELYDVFYHIKKLYLRPEAMPFLQQERLSGIEIPFVQLPIWICSYSCQSNPNVIEYSEL